MDQGGRKVKLRKREELYHEKMGNVGMSAVSWLNNPGPVQCTLLMI